MRRARILLVVVCTLVLAAGAYAATGWLKGSLEEELQTLAAIQPGLGTVMIEYGARYTNTFRYQLPKAPTSPLSMTP